LNVEGSNEFRCELYVRTPDGRAARVGIPLGHYTAADAFAAAVQAVGNYENKYAAKVATIDNPCNADFVNKQEQIQVLENFLIFV
jgi:hypothetical protein